MAKTRGALASPMRLAHLLFIVLVLAGCASPAGEPSDATPPATQEAMQGAAGPDWSFTSIEGETFSRDAPPRDATLLFFMATWCSSCRSMAPAVAEVHEEFAGRSVATYSLDFDASESAADVRRWQEEYDQPWPHGIDEGLRMQRALAVRSQSSVLVLDAEGQIVRHFGYGQATVESMREALETALGRA